jgi:hypothetical protein
MSLNFVNFDAKPSNDQSKSQAFKLILNKLRDNLGCLLILIKRLAKESKVEYGSPG